eukprot:jgi/Botrbrau1/11995/Bobra.0115s0030.1
MASYKRKSEDFSVERKEVFIPTAQWKKSCDGGLHSHPGVLQQFFRDLGMWESRQQPKVEEILPAFTGYLRSVSDQAWACFGELNLLLGSFTHKFSEVDVRHMHSYTRCNKERVFEKLVRSEEASVQPTGSHAQAPLHMQMTACILERLYKDYPEAVICIYVIRPPAWMQSWAQKWGYSTPTITLLALQAFPRSQLGFVKSQFQFGALPRTACTTPARTLYVPLMYSS